MLMCLSRSLQRCFLNINAQMNQSSVDFLKRQLLIQEIWDGARASAFQVMPILLIHGSHAKKHWCRPQAPPEQGREQFAQSLAHSGCSANSGWTDWKWCCPSWELRCLLCSSPTHPECGRCFGDKWLFPGIITPMVNSSKKLCLVTEQLRGVKTLYHRVTVSNETVTKCVHILTSGVEEALKETLSSPWEMLCKQLSASPPPVSLATSHLPQT